MEVMLDGAEGQGGAEGRWEKWAEARSCWAWKVWVMF